MRRDLIEAANQHLTSIAHYTTRVLLRVFCKVVTDHDGGSVVTYFQAGPVPVLGFVL
jgi:hypothetical protein